MPAQVRAPRTLEEGRFEHSVGLRFATPPALRKSDVSFGLDLGEGFNPLGVSPSYALRYGVLEWLEVGAEIHPANLRLETAVQLLESRMVDLALGLDGGYSFEELEHDTSSRFSAAIPLLAGLNLHRNLTVIGMAAPAIWSNGLFVQVGGGIDLRLGSLSLRPTFAQMIRVKKEDPTILYDGGSVGPAYGTSTFYLLGLDVAFGSGRSYGGAGIF